MKINKTLFWTFSLGISILSCYLFQLSSVQLYSDGDYMQSLRLSPDADTPAVVLAGTVLLTYAAAIGYIILLIALLIIVFLKEKEITISQADFILDFKNGRPRNIVVKLFAYVLTIYWLWNFIQTTKVKFVGSLLFFTIVATLVTWTYTLWTMNLARGTYDKLERTTVVGLLETQRKQ